MLRKLSSLRINCNLFTSSKKLQDWQYAQHIHQNLKQGQINQAIQYLINSHLDNKILDIQTYNNVHQAINEHKFNLTYHELTYKLYRDKFKPHILMTQWMKKLLASEDQKIQTILKNDYEYLGIKIPTQEEESPSATPPPAEEEVKQKKQENPLKHKIEPEEIRQIIEAMLGKYSRVILHDVQVDYDNFDEGEEYQYEDEEEQQEEEITEQVSSFTKIRIGKIQILGRKDEEPND